MKVAFLHVEDKRNNPEQARKLAQIMLASVRRVIPAAHVIQMTDFDTPALEGVDEVGRLDMDTPFFMTYRLRHLTRLKGETLILDTDTVVLQDPSSVFNMEFDVCLTMREKRVVSSKMGYTKDDPLMPFNTGVMFSRSPVFWCDALAECRKLEDRHQEWFGDQIAVAKVVNQRTHDIAIVGCSQWNYTPKSEHEDLSGRGIVHFKGAKKKEWMLRFKNKPELSLVDPYSTHLEALVKTALETTGGILELGCGNYSTPILAAIAKAQERKYVAQSSNVEWASKFNGSVKVISWDGWTPPRNEDSPDGKWGMVFMDSDEKTWDRVKRIPALAEVTDTVVLHDADVSMHRNGWAEAEKAFPDITIFDRFKPWTAVMRKSC